MKKGSLAGGGIHLQHLVSQESPAASQRGKKAGRQQSPSALTLQCSQCNLKFDREEKTKPLFRDCGFYEAKTGQE